MLVKPAKRERQREADQLHPKKIKKEGETNAASLARLTAGVIGRPVSTAAQLVSAAATTSYLPAIGINSNPRTVPATPATSHRELLSASPTAAAIITTPKFGPTSSSQDEPQSASILQGRLDSADFDGQTSFLSTDGRVKNPVPSKLQGMADNKNGNFAVMHIDLACSEKSMRNDAAKRTSEGTEAAARIANQAGYQSVKRTKLAWLPQDQELSPPQQRIGLTPNDAKAEQTRLLNLLRSVNPARVVDQLRQAVVFFGGDPGAPTPESKFDFPQSSQSNGSGSLFVSWIAEIFPASADYSSLQPIASATSNSSSSHHQTSPIPNHSPSQNYSSSQPDDSMNSLPPKNPAAEAASGPDATAVPVKRGRGRPKGSKGKPKNKDQPPPDSDPMGSAGHHPSGSWPGQLMYPAHHDNPSQSDTGTPAKKRGRPKGSKNKPKNNRPVESANEPAASHDANEAHDSFMSPMTQLSNSNTGPLDLSNMLEPSNVHSQGNWPGIGIPGSQDASPMASRKRKGDNPQPDTNSNMLPGIQQDGTHALDPNGKRRRFSKDNPVYSHMGQPTRMNSSESPVQNVAFHSPSQQMMASNSFDPSQQPNRKPGARSQPPSRPGPPLPHHQQFNQQPGQPASQQQPFPQQSQHKSPILGGNSAQPPTGGMDMTGSGLSRSVMYNQQQQQQFQQFMSQQRLSVDINPAANSSVQFNQAGNDGKSPMFPQSHMVRAASGDAGMHHQQRPSPASQNAQLSHDGSHMSTAGFAGRAPPATSAGASPSMNSSFPNYAARGFMGLNYSGMSGGRVPDATSHSFGGSAGQIDSLGNTDPASMRNRMYQSMQQQPRQ